MTPIDNEPPFTNRFPRKYNCRIHDFLIPAASTSICGLRNPHPFNKRVLSDGDILLSIFAVALVIYCILFLSG
jgi:hypothetical protein